MCYISVDCFLFLSLLSVLDPETGCRLANRPTPIPFTSAATTTAKTETAKRCRTNARPANGHGLREGSASLRSGPLCRPAERRSIAERQRNAGRRNAVQSCGGRHSAGAGHVDAARRAQGV